MSWIILINVACIFFSFWVAETQCKQWGSMWWLNMTASALNAVIVLTRVV